MQLNALFLSFVAAVVLATAAAAFRYVPPGYRARFIAGFGGWVVFAATLGVSAWNVVGIVSLANVVVRNVLISPAVHLISTEVRNAAIGSFPCSFIPTLIVPLALLLHVLAIRSLSMIRNPVREPIDGPSCLTAGCITS